MTPRLPNHKACCGCSACHSICPASAIVMKPDREGFLQPVIDPSKCVHCGKCEKVCPVLHHGKPRKPIAVYAAKAKDDKLRAGSASGGIFTLLALYVLKRDGVVFGAGFDHADWRVIHKAAHNEEELDDLRGSKYVQSDVGDTYKETKQLLDDGKEVLYSGCPCQIAALLNFLGKPYPNLTTVDLICHGVPSPLAWRKYLDDREREAGAKIALIHSRRYCKWQDFSLSLHFETGKVYSNNIQHDNYMLAFSRHWTQRHNCFKCSFRQFASGADISLGDNWSMSIGDDALKHSLGISLIIPCSNQGDSLLYNITHTVDTYETDTTTVNKYNWTLYKDPGRSRLRKTFFKRILLEPFDRIATELYPEHEDSFVKHLAWWIKRLIINHEINKF